MFIIQRSDWQMKDKCYLTVTNKGFFAWSQNIDKAHLFNYSDSANDIIISGELNKMVYQSDILTVVYN